MSGLTDEQTNQILNAEKQLMSERQQFKNYAQARLILASNEEKFKLSLKELESAEDKPCFQPLGKAYLMRPRNDLLADFNHLSESNKKEQEESNKMMKNLEQKMKESEKNLHEILKYAQLSA